VRPTVVRPGPRPNNRYQFRNNDIVRLRQRYQSRFGCINRARGPHFVIGGYIPLGYRRYFQPVPPDLLRYLPPPPGYRIGYYGGYCVVYDPVTFAILSFVDLLGG